MPHCEKRFVVFRDSTPSERREEIAAVLLGGAYSLVMWATIGLQLWRLWPQP